jgi:hypothetical protein
MSNLWHRIQAVLGAGLVYLAAMQPQLTGKAGQLAAIILGIAALVGADPKKLRGAPPALLLLVFLLPLQGCAFFQKPAVQKVVRCTGDVLATCQADLVPLLACLDVSNPTACVLAVGNAAGCAGKEALACKVREAAAPSVVLTLVSPTADEQRRQKAASLVYTELGVRPEAP